MYRDRNSVDGQGYRSRDQRDQIIDVHVSKRLRARRMLLSCTSTRATYWSLAPVQGATWSACKRWSLPFSP